jgi:1,4-alpha-glucan branching enzyme
MSEEGGWRKNAFDCEQDGVLAYFSMTRGELYQNPVNFFVDGYLKIVTNTKNGRGLGGSSQQTKRYAGAQRYYTNCITNHDYQSRNVCGNRLKIGYAALYAPYIPLWYMGDEFGAEATNVVLYDRAVDFGLIDSDPEKGIFYEDVKQMLAIRRTYQDMFEYWPLCHRDTNICEVTVDGLDSLENYARYAGNRMILIVANNQEDASGVCTVHIPFAEGFTETYDNYRVTDLLTGQVIAVGRADTVDGFSAVVPYQYCGVFLVEGLSAQ